MTIVKSGMLGCFVLLCGLMFLGACTSTVPEGKPLPELTFVHMGSFPVNVARIDVENLYDAGSDPKDMSSSFPSPPDITLRRYAESRLQAVGAEGTLKFVIEEASVHHSLVQPAGKFTTWMGVHRKDLYEVFMKIRMYEVAADGQEGTHSILNMKRSIAIPQHYSVADKELEKFKFLETMMQDVDGAVTGALRDKMNLSDI